MQWVSQTALGERRSAANPKRLHERLVPGLSEQIIGLRIEGNRIGCQQAGCPFLPHLAGLDFLMRISPSLTYGIEEPRFVSKAEKFFRSLAVARSM